ncbi:transcriptional regulator [Corallococcus exercitus]|uniref:Transcriptional regulator n=1 Tax=Corallococcus exercitus TaxID=2316736 RepID=A0A7Y4NDY4_9BACT|nr:transcriptional regulator [Corallococcus exercitus]NOK10389.1 transcriptional regulator [Corallococcus exercitus]
MKRTDIARLTALERKALLEELAAMVATGELGLGDASRILRGVMLGMDRKTFAQAMKLSTSVVATLEDDPKANPTLETLNKVFAPFGGKVALSFPRLEEPPPLDDAKRQRRDMLRAALAKSRRRRRSAEP